MTPPTPAVVKAALEMTETATSTESHRIVDEMAREKGSRPSVIVATILSYHIRAIAAEMRNGYEFWHASSRSYSDNVHMANHANSLREFADQLEGKQ
jgi:RimJ/RimL family protein N-acetyltransferase